MNDSKTVLNPKSIPTACDVVIVGAGVSGLSALIKLKEKGITNAIIIDKANRIGGTWALNDYPGLHCDVMSELYSLGYAPNPNWSCSFASQAEIQSYIEKVAHDFKVVDNIFLEVEMQSAQWQENEKVWKIQTDCGTEITTRFFIPAPGFIGEAKMPYFPGQEKFKGTIFHSGAWNHHHDLSGERVAVIGCGASAIQFLPEIQPKVNKLYSFQRTPTWVLPKPEFNVPNAVSKIFKTFPQVQKAIREIGIWSLELTYPLSQIPKITSNLIHPISQFHIRRFIKDKTVIEKLTPNHIFLCKRPLLSNKWYKALAADNVEIVFNGLDRFEEDSVVTSDGTKIKVDTVIFGTGYTAGDLGITHRIFNTQGVSLSKAWNGSPRSYMGLAIKDFPNMFMMLAPNAQSHIVSVMWTSEHQAIYISAAIKKCLEHEIKRIVVKDDILQAFVDDIDTRLAKLPMQTHYCESYYNDSKGRNHIVWPEWGFRIKKKLSHFNLNDYVIE